MRHKITIVLFSKSLTELLRRTCTFEEADAPPLSASLPPYLPLSDQLSLQMVDLEEGAVGAQGAYRPDCSYGPPGRPGQTFDLLDLSLPKPAPSVHIAAAHGERLVQAAVKRGLPGRLQVSVGGGPERHFQVRSAALLLKCHLTQL